MLTVQVKLQNYRGKVINLARHSGDACFSIEGKKGLKISKGSSEYVNRTTDNTIAKRKGQTTIYKTYT